MGGFCLGDFVRRKGSGQKIGLREELSMTESQ